jgi:hypothetical protein
MAPDRSAAKVALLVGGGALALLFLGSVWTFATRLLARSLAGAVQILVAVGLAYAAYELYSGWAAAGEDATTGDAHDVDADLADVEETVARRESPADVREAYVEGDITEAELERELEEAVE